MASYSAKVALLGNILDYAGTFPPAALPVAEALKAAATFHGRAKHPWLLSKMVLPISELKKLGPRSLHESDGSGAPWSFAALGTSVSAGAEFVRQVEWDLRELRHCQERGAGSSYRQTIVSYETKLPPDLLSHFKSDETYPFFRSLLDRFLSLTNGALEPFFELGWQGDWRRDLRLVSEALADWCDEQEETSLVPGLKIRTGGTVVPSAESVAEVIVACTSKGLRFKATQGLHHAVTSSQGLGFVNLFAALAFSQVLGGESFDKAEVERCLEETDPKRFEFQDTALQWREHRIDVEHIEAARRRHGASFGSCSLDEPDEALARHYGESKR